MPVFVTVVMVVFVAVIMIMTVFGLKFGVMVVHVDFTPGQALLKVLHQSNFALITGNAFFDARDKRIDHMRLIAQVIGLGKADRRVFRGNLVDVAVNPVDQPTSEQKVGRNDNLLEAKFERHFEATSYGRKGNPRIHRF